MRYITKTALAATLLLTLALPSFAQLTRQDVEEIIRQALEPIKQEINAIKLDIAEMRGEIKAVRAEMKVLEGKMATKDDIIALQRETAKRIDSLYYQMWAIWAIIFVTILAAIFGGPIFAEWWRRRQELKAEVRRLREKAHIAMREHPEYAEAYRSIGLI